jgi:hypothetical protein
MIATSGFTKGAEPDMVLIGELMEEMGRHPPAVAARKLLVEHYSSIGWAEAALENAKELEKIAPEDSEVKQFLQTLDKKPELPAPSAPRTPVKKPVSIVSLPVTETLQWDPRTSRYVKKGSENNKGEVSKPKTATNLSSARQDLSTGYEALEIKARYVLADLLHLQALQTKADLPQPIHTSKIRSIAEGRKKSGKQILQPNSVRAVAQIVRGDPTSATKFIITDLETIMKWIRDQQNDTSGAHDDELRAALVKRRVALEAVLPEELRIHCEHALMHVEHENLSRNYANTETMYGDSVKDIPRANFYVTEDNYAWDMEELVAAIKANNGILRNPLSKEMFTPKDVKEITMHDLGKPLAALAVKQREMAKGVRPDTIERMEKLSLILLEDQTTDALPSRVAVDEFLAYIATCTSCDSSLLSKTTADTTAVPENEQKAIEDLKCPAKDSHTGQSYDFSIGEAVRDAKGNQVCFHKTGDFIKQAAAHLRQKKGVAADAASCIMM